MSEATSEPGFVSPGCVSLGGVLVLRAPAAAETGAIGGVLGFSFSNRFQARDPRGSPAATRARGDIPVCDPEKAPRC